MSEQPTPRSDLIQRIRRTIIHQDYDTADLLREILTELERLASIHHTEGLPTPRTDYATTLVQYAVVGEQYEVVSADFARQLERELAACEARAYEEAKAIPWHKLSEKRPAENQMGWITGIGADQIMGPYPWKEPIGWLDLLATPEAGACYNEDNGATHWTEEENINMPRSLAAAQRKEK